MSQKPSLSIVATVYNEADSLQLYIDALDKQLSDLNSADCDVIFVNDGSQDDSLDILKDNLSKKHSFNISIINFSRNFGKEAAIKAGLDHAKGDAVIVMDSDLEDPVELIPQLVDEWVAGSDVVYTVRRKRFEGIFKRFFAFAFYRVINCFSDIPIYYDAGDYRLLDRQAVDALKRLPERNRFSKGLFNWIGFKNTYIEYDRHARKKGQTKWSFASLWHYAVDGIISFSTAPLRFWIFIGGFVSVASIVYGTYLVIRTLVYGVDVPGYASIMVMMTFLNGIILLNLGIMSEYISRIVIEVKARPSYFVKEILESK